MKTWIRTGLIFECCELKRTPSKSPFFTPVSAAVISSSCMFMTFVEISVKQGQSSWGACVTFSRGGFHRRTEGNLQVKRKYKEEDRRCLRSWQVVVRTKWTGRDKQSLHCIFSQTVVLFTQWRGLFWLQQYVY